MNSFKTCLLFFIILPFLSSAGETIKGHIADAKTKLPICYATVYIDGTTLGTITDSLGNFQLHHVVPPCRLVVSHVGYNMQSVYLEDVLRQSFDFRLKEREVVLSSVDVFDKNMREKNLAFFRKTFLGSDVWGKYATIENENALSFSIEYKTEQREVMDKFIHPSVYRTLTDPLWNSDSTMISYKVPLEINVQASEPIVIELPLLGYRVTFDMVGFMWRDVDEANPGRCSILGYYYYEPIPFASRRDSIRITRNRLKVYYNSSLHFCRSAYSKQLSENGYELFKIADTPGQKTLIVPFELDSFMVDADNYVRLIGLGGKSVYIRYYGNGNGSPIDLMKSKGQKFISSVVEFRSDTCYIRRDGTIPNLSISFGSEISNKRIGAMLPSDYVPAVR